jgi:hypothetical protein
MASTQVEPYIVDSTATFTMGNVVTNGITSTSVTSNTVTSGNIVISNTLSANGTTGTTGQVLTSTGTGNVVWANQQVQSGKALYMNLIFGG